MAQSLYHSELMLNLNTRLFINALEGVTEEHAKQRISDNTNPLHWLAPHIVWARYNMCALMGKPAHNPYKGWYEGFKPYDPSFAYPSLADVREEWQKSTDVLKEALSSVTEERLAADSPFKSPIGDHTIRGTIAFLTQHESYSIGQMAFMKKYFTNEGMKYM